MSCRRVEQKGKVVCRAEGLRCLSCRRVEQKGRVVCRAEGQRCLSRRRAEQKGKVLVVQKGRTDGLSRLSCRRAVVCRAEGQSFVMQTLSLFCPTKGHCCFVHQFLSYTNGKHCRSKYVY